MKVLLNNEQEDIPLAYKEGRIRFGNCDLLVDKRVYIPTIETQSLVEYAIQDIQSKGLEQGVLIDVGTGAGNIVIALAKQFPKAQIIATDISHEALVVAAENIAKNEITNIQIIHTDLVHDLVICPDYVVANLPWGDNNYLLKSNTKKDLQFMPPIAIFAPQGLMGAYVALCEQILLKGWKTHLLIESGVLPKSVVAETFDNWIKWQYISLQKKDYPYSITQITFDT